MNEEDSISKKTYQGTQNFNERHLIHEVLESTNKILENMEEDKLPDFEYVPSPPPFQEEDK